MTTPSSNKDTIYIDIDDEITAIIDKVHSSQGKIIALVLPKRATVFQSIVNMKLLKRSAEEAKKHLVLITSEAGLLPLAGAVGLHVAKTPQSKPEIPLPPDVATDNDTISEDAVSLEGETPAEGYTSENAGNRPVGELARGTAAATPGALAGVETLDLPDDEDIATVPAVTKPKVGKNKKLKIPNFNKFRMRLVLGGLLLVLLLVGLYVCLAVLPKATIAISTNASDVNVNLTMTLDTTAKTLDTTQLIVPAKTEDEQKTSSQQVPTTGQKNNGDRATGSVTMTTCATDPGQLNEVPAGTGISANGLTYITQGDASFQFVGGGSGCFRFKSDGVSIKAQSPGEKYNVGNTDFAVAGRSDVTASGSADGGTDSIIKVVSQADVDSAKQKLTAAKTDSVKRDLEQELRQDGLYPISATFKASDPVITTSSSVGDQADTVTVTATVTYSMFGAEKAHLQTLLKSDINTQVDTSKEAILDDGLAKADFKVLSAADDKDQVSMQATAMVGPHINVAALKKQAAGKKSGAVQTSIGNLPGVTDVNIHLSPFWVGSIPNNTSKITVTVGKTAKVSHDGTN